MERETKVGLLAGLAVIICFSVILANRGRRDAFASASGPYFVDSSSRSVQGTSFGSRPEHVAQGKGANRPAAEPVVQALPNLVPVSEASRRNVEALREPLGGAERSETALLASGQFVVRPGDAVSKPQGERMGGSDVIRPRGDANPTLPSHSEERVVPNGLKSGEEPSRGGQRYTVAAGDTLSKIAAAHYSSRSASVVQAIFESNRGVLESPDVLKPGVELLLPSVPSASTGLGASPGKAESKPASKRDAGADSVAGGRVASGGTKSRGGAAEGNAPTPEKPKGPPPSSGRWYEVKRGEGLQSIAREQLGDASRWKEIHELNRADLEAPERLREGSRIRLPERTAGQASRSRQRS